MITSCYYRSRI